jgi:alpha-tubulin suppressor-like RCC1 family protein
MVADVAAGWGPHTCARKMDSTLWCWGFNGAGQLGDGTTVTPRALPVQVTTLGVTVVEVAAGVAHTCARKMDGTLWCWGHSGKGQVGDGSLDTPKPSPVQVSTLGTDVAGMTAGYEHTCARKGDGTLWCWGDNNSGQLGDGTMTTPRPLPVQVSMLGGAVSQVAAGFYHTCARRSDGTLWCWGDNTWGQLGIGTASPFPRLTPVQVAALGSTVTAVAIGVYHSCATKADRTVWCWGRNNYGLLGDGTTMDSPTPVQVHLTCP